MTGSTRSMREVDANETSGALIYVPLIESSILFPLVLVDPEYHDRWCALKSGVVRRCSIEV